MEGIRFHYRIRLPRKLDGNPQQTSGLASGALCREHSAARQELFVWLAANVS
jgi:hypothetical protein